MRPTSGTTITRPDLGTIAYEYMLEASEQGFIGLEVMPIFEVAEKAANYPIIPIEALLKMPDTKRSARGNYNRSDYEFEQGDYSCEEHGWEEAIDDEEAALYSRFFDAEEVAVMRAMDIILRAQELRIATAVFNESNLSNAAVSIPWSTAATAVPRADVKAGKQAMRASAGLMPNTGVCSLKVLENLLICAEIKDALRYTNPIEMGGIETQKAQLAAYFGLDRLLVGGAIKDSAKKGQDFSLSDIWDDEYFGLVKVSSGGPDLKEPALGRTMLWTGDSPDNTVVETYREEKIRSNIVRVRHNVDDDAFTFKGAGYLLKNITA